MFIDWYFLIAQEFLVMFNKNIYVQMYTNVYKFNTYNDIFSLHFFKAKIFMPF